MSKRIQSARYERKFVVSEALAREIREYARGLLELDEHGVGHPDGAYPVHSIYLDSDAMKTYWDTLNGVKNRFKLRVRYYSEDADAPVYLEVKRRVNRRIVKQRAAVRREAAIGILGGQDPGPGALVASDPQALAQALAAFEDFNRLVRELHARPKVHVAYLREAYMPASEDNSTRLTLDRLVCCAREETGRISTVLADPLPVWSGAVVIELKFTDVLADWCINLVRTFGLRQCGAAKYAQSVSLMGGRTPRHQHLPIPDRDWHWPGGREGTVPRRG